MTCTCRNDDPSQGEGRGSLQLQGRVRVQGWAAERPGGSRGRGSEGEGQGLQIFLRYRIYFTDKNIQCTWRIAGVAGVVARVASRVARVDRGRVAGGQGGVAVRGRHRVRHRRQQLRRGRRVARRPGGCKYFLELQKKNQLYLVSTAWRRWPGRILGAGQCPAWGAWLEDTRPPHPAWGRGSRALGRGRGPRGEAGCTSYSLVITILWNILDLIYI